MPIHPQVIELGFLDYVKAQRKLGHEKLFPDALKKERGQIGYNVGRWFAAQIKTLGLEGCNLSFHSLRHNFEDRLREAELHGTPIGQYLGGRSAGGVSASYGSGFSTAKLTDALAKVEYPTIEFNI